VATADVKAPSIATDYPPAPWRLRGQAHFHVMAVRAERLAPTPDGFAPLVLGGRALVVVGWVDYRGGSVLRYGELLAAVVGRWSGGLTTTVTHMWVDSPASRAGGRELWGYPKELAEFELAIDPSGTARASDAASGDELARGSFQALVTSPRALRATAGTVQPLHGRLVAVRALFRSRPSVGRGSFTAPPGSPLAFVVGARKLISVGMRDFDFTFGV
jgi:Acetoacetate decarboxylase (ADC)